MDAPGGGDEAAAAAAASAGQGLAGTEPRARPGAWTVRYYYEAAVGAVVAVRSAGSTVWGACASALAAVRSAIHARSTQARVDGAIGPREAWVETEEEGEDGGNRA